MGRRHEEADRLGRKTGARQASGHRVWSCMSETNDLESQQMLARIARLNGSDVSEEVRRCGNEGSRQRSV